MRGDYVENALDNRPLFPPARNQAGGFKARY